MTIQIDGVNTVNKGAELMLRAVVKEIEENKKASVTYLVYNDNALNAADLDIETGLIVKHLLPSRRLRLLIGKMRLVGICHRLNLPFNEMFLPRDPGVNLVLDAAGYRFSQHWKIGGLGLRMVMAYYKSFTNAEVVLLPQTFGPFNGKNDHLFRKILNEHVNKIYARDSLSFLHLKALGVNMKKVSIAPDFTTLVSVEGPNRIRDEVLFIPNARMIDRTGANGAGYVSFIANLVNTLRDSGLEVVFLNHEGRRDLGLCERIVKETGGSHRIIDGLNAIEIKRRISESRLLLSSRYHGCASALSTGTPCLSTSWSHKYAELFTEYGMRDMVLHIDDPIIAADKILSCYEEDRNLQIREKLVSGRTALVKKNRAMWQEILSRI